MVNASEVPESVAYTPPMRGPTRSASKHELIESSALAGPPAQPSAVASKDKIARDIFLRSNGIDPRAPMQLEIWPDVVRAMPNDFARSSLFSVRNKTVKRESLEGQTLFHIEQSVKITYTGIELRSDDDELIWQEIINMAKGIPLGEPVEFTLTALCRGIGWSINARNFNRARACISRLKATELRVEHVRLGRGIGLSLIREYEFQREVVISHDGCQGRDLRSKYRVWIHPNLVILFAGDRSTRFVWNEYRQLKPIARRLADYACSHRQPFPLPLDAVHRMCKSNCTVPRKWRAMVLAACAELVQAQMLKRAWLKDGAVHFERP